MKESLYLICKVQIALSQVEVWGKCSHYFSSDILTNVIPKAVMTISVSWNDDIAPTIYPKVIVNNPKSIKLVGCFRAIEVQHAKTKYNTRNKALEIK